MVDLCVHDCHSNPWDNCRASMVTTLIGRYLSIVGGNGRHLSEGWLDRIEPGTGTCTLDVHCTCVYLTTRCWWLYVGGGHDSGRKICVHEPPESTG